MGKRTRANHLVLSNADDSIDLVSVNGGAAAVFSAPSPLGTTTNEDGAAVLHFGKNAGVLAVTDGVGGGPAGEQATRHALQGLRNAVDKSSRGAESLRTATINGIEEANSRVRALGSAAACTLAALSIEHDSARPFHVGDSMILVVGQRGAIKHQTIPHGPVGYGIEAGLIDEQEGMEHADRNVVSNLVGTQEMRIEVGPTLKLALHDTALLATDGLSDNAYVEEIIEIIRKGPLNQCAEQLKDLCTHRMLMPKKRDPSKADDLTFILYRRM